MNIYFIIWICGPAPTLPRKEVFQCLAKALSPHLSFRNEMPCSMSHQEFRDHEHPSHTSHVETSSILVPKWALAAPSPPQHQHQGPPRGSFTPKCHPEGIPASGYPRLS